MYTDAYENIPWKSRAGTRVTGLPGLGEFPREEPAAPADHQRLPAKPDSPSSKAAQGSSGKAWSQQPSISRAARSCLRGWNSETSLKNCRRSTSTQPNDRRCGPRTPGCGGLRRRPSNTTKHKKCTCWTSIRRWAWTPGMCAQAHDISSHQALHAATARRLKQFSPLWAGAATTVSLLSYSSWSAREVSHSGSASPAAWASPEVPHIRTSSSGFLLGTPQRPLPSL